MKGIKNVLILGYGRSGQKVREFFKKIKINTVIYDDKTNKIEINWNDIDLLYVSPGIPMIFPHVHFIVNEAAKRLIPKVGDIDILYYSNPDAFFLGVTGTDGKTTVCTLISHLLDKMGIDHILGGNFPENNIFIKSDVYILELSNTILEKSSNFILDYGIITNIATEHLDIHLASQYEFYKYSILKKIKGKEQFFFAGAKVKEIPFAKFEPILKLKNLDNEWKRPHNKFNLELVYSALNKKFGLKKEELLKFIKDYKFPKFRQTRTFFFEDGGIVINDSKCTNINSCIAAFESYSNFYWIAGGIFKDKSLTLLKKYKTRIKGAIFYGKDSALFYKEFRDDIECYRFDELKDAIKKALKIRIKGGNILFSPACSSFDQFKDYNHRGENFDKMFFSLINKS